MLTRNKIFKKYGKGNQKKTSTAMQPILELHTDVPPEYAVLNYEKKKHNIFFLKIFFF